METYQPCPNCGGTNNADLSYCERCGIRFFLPDLILMLGLQGSGKTTRALNLVAEKPKAIRVNKDELRLMLHGGKYSPENEILIRSAWEILIHHALDSGLNVIIDDAGNLNPATREAIEEKFGRKASIQLDETCLTTPVEECIKRDVKRANGVGESVIRAYADRYLPKPATKADPSLPKAILLDLDGCLAIALGRKPLDYMAAGTDEINQDVKIFVNNRSQTVSLIVMTGREEHSRAVLTEWLGWNGVNWSAILMRPDEDRSSPEMLKEKMLTGVLTAYNPILAIEDDPRVVRMLKSYGIPTWEIHN